MSYSIDINYPDIRSLSGDLNGKNYDVTKGIETLSLGDGGD
jgi:hypothetical protein